MGGYDAATYVPVAERLNKAIGDIQSIMADPPTMLSDTMGFIRVTILMKDGRSATGTASFELGKQGRSAQATNPIEDGETSAVGRALALLGYESARGIASAEEVREAQRRQDGRPDSQQASQARQEPARPAQANGERKPCPKCRKPMPPSKFGGGYYCFDCKAKFDAQPATA